jgi:tetratricopeptide (TPR) repeat protein
MIKRNLVLYKQSLLAICLLAIILGSQLNAAVKADNHSSVDAVSSLDNSVAPNVNPGTGLASGSAVNQADKNKSITLHGKTEFLERKDDTLHALEGARMYQRGVLCLSTKRFGVAADCFKTAGDQFALTTGNERFLAESRFAEAQSRRMLGQKQTATQLYQEAVDLFRQYDPLSPYLKAALDNLNQSTGLHGRASLAQARLRAITAASSIQSVEREVYLKGSATVIDSGLHAGRGAADVTNAFIKKTVLQAFVKMTCLETAELGSNYYTAADRYLPLKANGKTLALSATTGFLVPIIRIRLNGRFYNVGVDLPELSSNRRTVYLVTDGRNVLAIDPGNYDVWKLYAKFKTRNADFEWRKLTHTKYLPSRINLP